MTHYLSDILQIIENLSLEFQKEDIDYSKIFKRIEVCLTEIRQNYVEKNIYGENCKSFCQDFEEGKYLPTIIIERTEDLKKEAKIIMKEFGC